MELQGELVRLRSLTEADAGWVLAMLLESSVAQWWGESTAATVDEDLIRCGDGEWLAIERDGETAGIVGFSEEADPIYRHAGIDISLRTGWQDRGLGTDSVRTLARWLIEERGHHRITIDPAAANARAIACYARVGFKPVGVLRQYERSASGEFRDGLLMDMLAGELREAG